MKLLVSACLMGMYCRYDGKTSPLPQLSRLLEEYSCIPVCPELFGGLPTPRVPAERRKDRIINKNGEDVTEAYVRGAAETLRLAKLCNCGAALLKERSPSCGCGAIYDGTFSGRLVQGDGLAAQTLKRYGIPVYGESQLEALLPEDDLIFGTMLGFREELREEERAAIKAAREAAAARAKAEAEAAAAAAQRAAEEAAAAQAAEDAAVAAALAEDNLMPFGSFSQEKPAEGGEDFSFPADTSNPFAELLKLGSLEQFSKPEPMAAAEAEADNVVFLTDSASEAPAAEDDDPDGNPFAALMKSPAEAGETPAGEDDSDENPFAALMKSPAEETAPTDGEEKP